VTEEPGYCVKMQKKITIPTDRWNLVCRIVWLYVNGRKWTI